MAELVLTIDTSEGRRRFGVLANAWSDLTPVLREFDKFKRGKIDELFESGGHGKWPARSEASEQRDWSKAVERANAAPERLRKKLTRELGLAMKRRRKTFEKTSATELNDSRIRQSRENAVARRYFVLKEFERQMAGGRLDDGAFQGADRRLVKSVKGLQVRMARQVGKEGNLLGKLPQTIRSRIERGTLVIDTSWNSPAARVLQEGGTVNNGAEVKPRPYLFWEPSDVEYLMFLLRERSMLAWAA